VKVTRKEGAKRPVRLALTEREAELLGALADFPWWHQQPAEHATLCESVYDALARHAGATSAGFVRPRGA
jgi:hypothetical protein